MLSHVSALLVLIVTAIAALAFWGRTPSRREYYARFRWHQLRFVSSWSLVMLVEIAWALTPSQLANGGPSLHISVPSFAFVALYSVSWHLVTRRIKAAGEPSFWQWISIPPRPD